MNVRLINWIFIAHTAREKRDTSCCKVAFIILRHDVSKYFEKRVDAANIVAISGCHSFTSNFIRSLTPQSSLFNLIKPLKSHFTARRSNGFSQCLRLEKLFSLSSFIAFWVFERRECCEREWVRMCWYLKSSSLQMTFILLLSIESPSCHKFIGAEVKRRSKCLRNHLHGCGRRVNLQRTCSR